MKKNRPAWYKTEAAKYAGYGTLFGCCFPIIATYIDITRLGLAYTLEIVQYVQDKYPIHFIIDTAPFFLGLFAFFVGRNLDQIKEKNELLKKTAQFKDQFLASMSHEIRTPMSGIIGMVDILAEQTELNELQREYIGIIQQSSQDLLSILNDILDLSKLEAGEMDVTKTEVSLHGVINKVLGLFLARAKQKFNYMESAYSDNFPKLIMADGSKLTQIISNLISNAIKFTDNGTIIIRSSIAEENGGQLKIMIEIIDSGIGISRENQSNLFKKFKQVNEGYSKSGKGTGLGLAICKKLVELMGGEIGVKSELTKGSNFWFTFYATRADEVKKSQEKINRNFIPEKKYNYKVLVADNIEVNIFIARTILEKLGCNVEVAINGQIALEKFEEKKFDLILMDIQMPGMDGLEATKILKSRFKEVPPIIGLSANGMEGDAEKYVREGMDDYLVKPLEIESITRKLDKWCHKKELK